MWVIDQMTPGNPAYNLPTGYRLRGPLDVTALGRSFNEIIKRHEALRTTFAVQDGEPLQRIHPDLRVAIQITALDHLRGEEREAKLQQLASEESIRPFDLSRLPLIRVSLFKLGDAEHVLIINLHHIVVDGLSIGLLLDELDACYRAFTKGGDPRLPALAVQYADFAAWERHTLANEGAHAKQIEFWRTQLGGGLPVLELPGDLPRPAVQSFKGSNVFFHIPTALAQQVKALGAREGCTFFMTVLAAFQVLLQRYSGAEDVVIGTPLGARTAAELEPLIGNFLNMAALRCDLSGNPTFVEVLRRVRGATLDAFSNSDVPFAAMMEQVTFERDPSRNPIFQVMLQVLSPAAATIGDLEINSFHFDLKFAQFDLSLHLYEEGGGYVGRFEYCTDLFYEETIDRLSAHFDQLIRVIVKSPEQRISDLPILAASERYQILNEWNDTAADFPADALLHELFEAQVERTPERTALHVGATALSYGALDARANRLAQALRSRGVGRGQRVGVCVERDADMLAVVLAILKAGAAYVPLDPSFPEARLRFMADDAQLALLVSTSALAGAVGLPRARQLLLDADARMIAEAPETRLSADPRGAQAGDAAYVIYTSGSTGKPKGVVIPHRAVVNFLTSMAREPGLGTDDVLVAVTTLSFDIAVLELLLPLTRGAAVAIASRDEAVAGDALRSLLERHHATVMQATPATWRLLLEVGWTGRTPFKALIGGEALPQDLADQLIARGVKVWNMYGPTETTVWSTCAHISDTSHGITIGTPIANTTVRIIDAHGNLCPIGVPGELCIGGEGVALGYWNRPDLTAERFTPDPFAVGSEGEGAARLYRTGDRARWRSNGTLEHLGRLDDQIKLRGFRIEAGEIEAGIAQHPAVREVAVIAREDASGDKRLVAYLVAESPPADLPEQLRNLVRAASPEYMVPAHFVTLEALPRTPNGKLDRKALPAPSGEALAPQGVAVAPRTRTEDVVLGVFRDVLGRTDFGVFENFFDLGGHSLVAMRVVSRVRQAFAVELPLRDLFAAPTVARLAARIDALGADAAPGLTIPPLEPAAEPGPGTLSFAQQRLWFLEQLEPGRTTYVMPGAIEMRGALDVPMLEGALGALVRRHESLRTTFVAVEGRPLQQVSEPGAWTLPIVDLRSEVDPRERLHQLLRQEVAHGFDLMQGPLFRAQLYRLAADTHVLLLAMHHIISDGWSLGILFRELGALYGGFCRGETTTLPALRLQYRDYARWQGRWLQGEALTGLLAHWRARLAGAPQVLELPADRPRPVVESNRGAIYRFTLPLELAEALRGLARREGATLYMTLLTGFTALLSRYSGQQDLLVGTPVTKRSPAEIEDVVGCFVNTLVLRADLSGDPSVREFLRRMREVCLDALAHQDLPFERLVEELRPARDLGRNPVVQVLFALQNAPLGPLDLPGLTLGPLDIDPGVAHVDLTLQVQETAAGLSGQFEYATDLFDERTIVRLATHWRSLLAAMVASPESRVGALPLLSDPERRQLLVEWNETAVDYPRESCVHHLVEAQARQSPEAVAVVFEDRRLTYRELDLRSNRLARRLRTLGAGPGVRVGLCLDRSAEMVVALLGILKAGAAYLPLDPAFPPERLRFMADDAQLSLLVSTAALAGSLGVPRERQVLLDTDPTVIATPPDSQQSMAADGARSEDPAYVIYTSGSTGAPKGVVIPHRAVVNFLTSMAREPGLTAADVVVAVTTLSFDIAVLELLLPLVRGATVVLATHDATFDGRALGSVVERHRATAMQATPVTWRLLLEAGWIPGAGFKALVGGEALPRDLADQLIAGGAELWNMYGPTETTVWSTCARITDTSHGITIGKPIANTTIRILDAGQQLCPVGVPGELCIGGDGVALGYWNRPELTAERFVPDPFGATPGATLYRTGDQARWRRDGTLEHLGRLDHQVKVRGFRIELGEIEARIARHAAVREVAVAVREDTPGDKRLVAYLVAEPPPADVIEAVRALLRAALPAYMVPSRFVMLQALPRTQNGKLDRKALPPPEETAPSGGVVAPRTPTEAMVMSAFRAVLERTTFDVFDNFFDLGGHSLMAARLMAKLRTATGLDLPLRHLFERPTVAALGEAIDALAWAASSPRAPARAANRVEIEL